MERDSRADTSLMAWFPNILWITLLSLAIFVSYFIVPKWEVSLRNSGKPTPGWLSAIIQASHFLIHYWYAILIVWAICAWRGRRDSSRPTR